MNLRVALTVFFVICILSCQSFALLEWFFGNGEEDSSKVVQSAGPKFEVISTDDKFLDFAKSLSKLTPLDSCYQIVVYSLQKKCGDLNEEELSKLSVQLLNCQSESEKRRVFPCTPSMTLAECTEPMDDIAWNSYQIVSNRARAMCYAAQQQQFRQLTETTVSRLVTAATDQLSTMTEIKEGQEQLQAMATDTIRKLFESQQELLVTHASLKLAQEDVFQHVSDNVKQLVTEKQLIATGNQQLAELIGSIKTNLEKTQRSMEEQEQQEKRHHEKVLQDLGEIQDKAKSVLNKIDESMHRLETSQDQLAERYAAMFDNLQRINSTVQHLLATVTHMQARLEERMGWLVRVLDMADDRLKLVTLCVSHIAYFVLVMATAAFLQTPLVARVLLMVIIVSNVASEVNYHTSLDFAGMTVLVFTTIVTYRLVLWMRRFSQGSKHTSPVLSLMQYPCRADNPLNPTELRALAATLTQLQQSLSETLNQSASIHCNGGVPSSPSQTVPESPPPAPSPRVDAWGDDDESPERESPSRGEFINRLRAGLSGLSPYATRSRSATPQPLNSSGRSSRASTPSRTVRCQASTRLGTPCRNTAVFESSYCHLHRHYS